MDIVVALENEKDSCMKVLKLYNLKYKTTEIKKLYIIYDYLTELLKNETDNVNKLQLQEDIKIIMEYLDP